MVVLMSMINDEYEMVQKPINIEFDDYVITNNLDKDLISNIFDYTHTNYMKLCDPYESINNLLNIEFEYSYNKFPSKVYIYTQQKDDSTWLLCSKSSDISHAI